MRPKILWSCICALILFTVQSFAQNAELTGAISDGTGARIPLASVEFCNEDTGVMQRFVADKAGYYYAAVAPGTYSVNASAKGFKTLSKTHVKVDVALKATLDLALVPGGADQTVTVTGTDQILQTSSAVGNLITGEEISRLPVNGRNYTTLELLAPGVGDVSKSQNDGTISGTNLYSINGQRPQDHNYLLDGIENDFFHKSSPGGSPPLDAITEFKVATNNSAEYGRSAGAAVSVVTKSGTSRFHGSAYEYLRNDDFDANNFFANNEGFSRTPLHLNNFGAAAGGPMLGANKIRGLRNTFFFLNYDGLRESQSNPTISTVPTAQERTGDFSDMKNTIYDPTTSTFNSSGAIVRTAFKNNTIPASMIDPSATAYFGLLPLPNRSGTSDNYVNDSPQTNNHDNWIGRVDYALNDRNTFFFRVLNQSVEQTTPQDYADFSELTQFNVLNLALGWTSALTQNSVLQLHLGYQLPSGPDFTRNTLGVTGAQFLAQNNIQLFSRGTLYDFLPTMNASGDWEITESGGTSVDELYTLTADYERQMGRSDWKAGFGFVPRKYFHATSSSLTGTATFTEGLTDSADNSKSGSSTASFMLGYPSTVQRGQGNGVVNARQVFTSYYLQFHRRMSNRMTLDAGMRYEFFPPIYDRDNHFGTLWVHTDPTSGGIIGTLLWAGINPLPDQVTGAVGDLPNRAGFGRALEVTDYNNLAPRLGASYGLNEKTVIRAGVGVYYNSTFFQESQDKSGFYPYNSQQSFTANSALLPNLKLEDPGPSYNDTTGIGGYAQDPNNRTPYSWQYNLFIERNLPHSITAKIGYVGSQNRKQIGYVYFNTAPVPGPGAVQARRLLPAYGDLEKGSNGFSSNYNALQIQVKKRYTGGLEFSANYTYSKSLDYQSSLAEIKTQNPFDIRADYSRSSFDITHILGVSYVYDLPFGRGRAYGSHMPAYADTILGGWSVQGITRIETGPPDNPISNVDQANVGTSIQRPNLVGPPNNGPKTYKEWFNTSSFVLPPQYTFGTAGAYIIQAPALRSWDMALHKDFVIVEGQKLDFRAEAFDFPNLTNFGDPNVKLSSGSFGSITSTRIANRELQFSLRYIF